MVVSGGIRVGEFKSFYLERDSPRLGTTSLPSFTTSAVFRRRLWRMTNSRSNPRHWKTSRVAVRTANAEIIRRLFRGDERGLEERDAVLLNAAAALFKAGKTKSVAVGWEYAADIIDSGKALQEFG